MLADGAANDAAANGGGITVQSGDGNKTWQYSSSGDNFTSSENIDIQSGKVLKIDNTEVLSATALSSSVVVDVASVNIDGATDIGADIVDADLLLIDDGAGGTNRKTTVARVKDYVLGGGQGANFSAINVSGMTTSQSVDAEQLDVSGISSLGQVSANTINVTGIVTASDFRAASVKKVNGGLIPLVGVSSATHAGIVTAFKFNGTGLEEFKVEDEMATITISGVAASTYTTNQTITAVQNQTTFTFGAGYEDGFVDVYLSLIHISEPTRPY